MLFVKAGGWLADVNPFTTEPLAIFLLLETDNLGNNSLKIH